MENSVIYVILSTMATMSLATSSVKGQGNSTGSGLSASAKYALLNTNCEKPDRLNHTSVQVFRLCFAREKCEKDIRSTPRPTTGVYCNMTWDNVMCWPYTPAGTVAKENCAGHISKFLTTAYATKRCMGDGMWYVDGNNVTWTDYTKCMRKSKTDAYSETMHSHMPTIQLIYRLGYGISLAILLVAIFLMLVFKRLHCQRNIVHVNLFVSFVLRAIICLLKDEGYKTIEVHDDSSQWQCRLMAVLLHYTLGANYMWIFVEGLYLHTLIIISVFSHNRVFKWYIVLGWVSPVLFVVPWIVVRVYLENTWCWSTHVGGYYWILKTPIIASIFVNFFFFINIIRVLFTKLMADNNRDSRRYRKLAKSTLVLIPLFGVYYVLLIIIPDQLSINLKLFKFYTETVINSFQGVIVAFLFCFLNGEVRGEIRKMWHRHRLRRDSRLPDSNTRTSRAFSSAAFFPRERGASITADRFAMNELAANTDTHPTNNDDMGIVFEAKSQNHVTEGNHDNGVHNNMCRNLSSVSEGSEETSLMLKQSGVS